MYPELHEKLSFYDVSINIREDRRRINTSTRRRDTIYYPRYRQSPNDFHPAFEAFSEAPRCDGGPKKCLRVAFFLFYTRPDFYVTGAIPRQSTIRRPSTFDACCADPFKYRVSCNRW